MEHPSKTPSLPQRRPLPHDIPPWVQSGAIFFLTLCAADRASAPLTRPGIPEILLAALRHYHDRALWHIHLALIMPDHLHLLISFPDESEIPKRLAAWKSYTAKQTGLRWQRDFFEHRLRHDESLEEKWTYILHNPVRKGLCPTPSHWPHILSPETPNPTAR
jgi:putative transposase